MGCILLHTCIDKECMYCFIHAYSRFIDTGEGRPGGRYVARELIAVDVPEKGYGER